MFRRNNRFETFLNNCARRLQYVYRSFQSGCRSSYQFGEFLYVKVQQGNSFVIRMYKAATNVLVGVVEDGRVYQCS